MITIKAKHKEYGWGEIQIDPDARIDEILFIPDDVKAFGLKADLTKPGIVYYPHEDIVKRADFTEFLRCVRGRQYEINQPMVWELL